MSKRASTKQGRRIGLPRSCVLLVLSLTALSAQHSAMPKDNFRLRPPMWRDRDDRLVPKPKVRDDQRDLFEIVHNTWVRHLSPEHHARQAADPGALNVNAWDEVPDSSWFTNRIGRRAWGIEEILTGLAGEAPAPGTWRILRLKDEGYTPGFDIVDGAGRRYVLKLDLPGSVERNSAAERISTLVMYAAGYNVPHNSIVEFRSEDLIQDEKSYYRDAVGKRRPMTATDLSGALGRLRAQPNGLFRGLASLYLPGEPLGPFIYTGTRRDDPNDLIPHELRRELRGLRVIASWINHVDVKDQNALDMYHTDGDGRSYVKHYLLDFGSSLGSGNFVHGPYRVGHEYIFDGRAIFLSFISLGLWQRPWEARGRILHPEVGYFSADLFDPASWKPNYPNLAFERMDDGDAYWGGKIVASFSDELVRQLAEAGRYSRAEVTDHVEEVLKRRRDAIGRYWLDRITPLEDFVLSGPDQEESLRFLDLALEKGYVEPGSRAYRFWVEDLGGAKIGPERVSGKTVFPLPKLSTSALSPNEIPADRFGRRPAYRLVVQSKRNDGRWALPVEVVLGYSLGRPELEVLGWSHAPK